MPDDKIPAPDAQTLDNFLRAEAKKLRAKDTPPTTRKAWEERRTALRKAMFAAMGPAPEKDCPLEPRVVGTLKRDGYQIEKIIFESQPRHHVTATLYLPAGQPPCPAVLVSSGHSRPGRIVERRGSAPVAEGYIGCGAGVGEAWAGFWRSGWPLASQARIPPSRWARRV